MRLLGFEDVRVTQLGADGGIDGLAKGAVAQVKFWSSPVGISEVQRLNGTALGGSKALFYSYSGFTAAALSFADRAGLPLFEFDTTWKLNALNFAARELVNARVTVLMKLQANVRASVAESSRLLKQAQQHTLGLKLVASGIMTRLLAAKLDPNRDPVKLAPLLELSSEVMAFKDSEALARISGLANVAADRIASIKSLMNARGYEKAVVDAAALEAELRSAVEAFIAEVPYDNQRLEALS